MILPKSNHFYPNFALIFSKFRPNPTNICPNLINFVQKLLREMRLHPLHSPSSYATARKHAVAKVIDLIGVATGWRRVEQPIWGKCGVY